MDNGGGRGCRSPPPFTRVSIRRESGERKSSNSPSTCQGSISRPGICLDETGFPNLKRVAPRGRYTPIPRVLTRIAHINERPEYPGHVRRSGRRESLAMAGREFLHLCRRTIEV